MKRSITPFALVLFALTISACSGGGGGGMPPATTLAPAAQTTAAAPNNQVASPAKTASPTPVASAMADLAAAPSPTATPSATPSASPAPTLKPTAKATATPVPSPKPTPTASPVPSPTPKPAATAVPTGTPIAQPSTMAAMSADDFVASMGVDLDLTTPPDSAQATIASSFAGLGVRHTRISILESDPDYEANVRSFFAANPNVHAYGLTNCAPPLGPYPKAVIGPSDVSGFQSRTGNHLDRIESVNEPNGTSDKNWVADTHACVSPLVGKTGGVPLVAPALVAKYGGADEKSLGAVSGVSLGNIHRYFSGRNPATTGWGGSDACGVYGALTWAICWAKVNAPGAPLAVTETGWNSDTEVDLLTQAKYVERVFFVNMQAGIAATSLYTFESYTGGDGFGGDGLVNTDFSQKPAYTALANITKLLSDPGATYKPTALPLAISPAPVTSGMGLRAMLLGKRNGSYELAIWQEVQSANPDKRGTDTIPAPVNATITLGALRTATLHAWQDDGSAPTSTLGLGLRFTVPVTDRLTIVELK